MYVKYKYILSLTSIWFIFYIYGGWSKFLYLQTAILREWKKYVRGSFANPTFVFRGGLMLKYVAKSFAQKNTFTNSGKTFAVSCWNPGGLCNGQSLHGPLDRQSCVYIYIFSYIYGRRMHIFVCLTYIGLIPSFVLWQCMPPAGLKLNISDA